MEPRAYRYRYAGNLFLPAFLTLWSLGWNLGLLAKGPNGPIRVNGRPGTPEQAQAFFWFGLIVGIPIACLAARLLLGWLNERVELHDRTLVWIDWRNRERVRAELGQLRAVRLGKNPFRHRGISLFKPQGRSFAPPLESLTIQTDAGRVPVSESIGGYEDLKARAFAAWEANVTPPPSAGAATRGRPPRS